MNAKPVLKQFGDLTRADLSKYPVWVSVHTFDYDEPWYDDTNEVTFRPWSDELPVGPENGMFVVRAKLTLADGRVIQGFITPQLQGEPFSLGTIQPHLFLPSGQAFNFWEGAIKRSAKERKALYSELSANPKKVFPIRFSAEKGLATGQVSGSIAGFCWCRGDKVQVYQ